MNSAPLFEWSPPASPYPDGVPVEVCRLFEKLANDLRANGYTRFSADAILHRIRWEMNVDRGDRAFKINNDHAAPLARWFLARNPSASKFFELRERISCD